MSRKQDICNDTSKLHETKKSHKIPFPDDLFRSVAPYFITPFNHSNSISVHFGQAGAFPHIATLPPSAGALKAANKSSTLVVFRSNQQRTTNNKHQQDLERQKNGLWTCLQGLCSNPFLSPLVFSNFTVLKIFQHPNILYKSTFFPTIQYSKSAAKI